MSYELVAGFETHIELATKTKIFCGCTTKFGGAPNSHCCPVCIGLPGTLPKLNREVVRYAIRAGLAVHGEIAEISKMSPTARFLTANTISTLTFRRLIRSASFMLRLL